MDFTLQDVLQGKLDAEIKLLNYFITLVKLHIWMSRKRGVTLNLSVLRTEKHSYMKNSTVTELTFQARWPPYIKFISET